MSEPTPADRPEPVDPFPLLRYAEETAERAARHKPSVDTSAGAPPEVLSAIEAAVSRLTPQLLELSHQLADDPEVAFEEHRSMARCADLIEAHGLTVQRGVNGLPTAARAEFGSGPTVAVLSEYDALPGIGHGCGHNVIASAGVGAFLALYLAAQTGDNFAGRVVWLGTPAEEGGSGKEVMARDGAFDDVDAAVMVHPATFDVADASFLGRRQLTVTFHGTTAHASAQPFMGRNALDAANLMYTGVALHRQQMPPTDRVHAVITEGGERPNVIPELAALQFYVRSEHLESLKILSTRLEQIAQGAALMTGCGFSLGWDETPPYLPLRRNGSLAAAWNRRYGDRGHELLSPDAITSVFGGSTDFGNVTFRIPGLHPMIKITDLPLSLHTRDFAAEATTEQADGVLTDAAYGLAAISADYLFDTDLRRQVDEEFEAAGGVIDVPTYFD